MKSIDLFFYYVNDFFYLYKLDLKSERTIESYKEGLNDFRKFLFHTKHLKVDNVTFSDISEIVI